jgi:coenzyme F420-reducing hydrogenase gamma subunit
MLQLRARAKKVVAVGSCACTGMPSAHRNNFDPEQTAQIDFLLKQFNYGDKVVKVAEVIPIDAQVAGCPMDLDNFMQAVNGLLTEFGHTPIQLKAST